MKDLRLEEPFRNENPFETPNDENGAPKVNIQKYKPSTEDPFISADGYFETHNENKSSLESLEVEQPSEIHEGPFNVFNKVEESYQNNNPFNESNRGNNSDNWETKKTTKSNNIVQSVLAITASIFIIVGMSTILGIDNNPIITTIVGLISLILFTTGIVAILNSNSLQQLWSSIFLCGLFGVIASILDWSTARASILSLSIALVVLVGIAITTMITLKKLNNTHMDFSILLISAAIVVPSADTMWRVIDKGIAYNYVVELAPHLLAKTILFDLIIIVVLGMTLERQLKANNSNLKSALYMILTPNILIFYGQNLISRSRLIGANFVKPFTIVIVIGTLILMKVYALLINSKVKEKKSGLLPLEIAYAISWFLVTILLRDTDILLVEQLLAVTTIIVVVYIQRNYIRPTLNIVYLLFPIIALGGQLSETILGSGSILAVILAIIITLDCTARKNSKEDSDWDLRLGFIIPVLILLIFSVRISVETLNIQEIVVELACQLTMLTCLSISIYKNYRQNNSNWFKCGTSAVLYTMGILVAADIGVYIGNIIGFGNEYLTSFLIYLSPVCVCIWSGIHLVAYLKDTTRNVCSQIIDVLLFYSADVTVMVCSCIVYSAYNHGLFVKKDIAIISMILTALFLLIAHTINFIRYSLRGNEYVMILVSLQLPVDILIINVVTNINLIEGIVYSIVIAVYGIYYVVAGTIRHSNVIKYLGLGFLICSEIKICVVDVWDEATIIRAVALIACGILCFITSYGVSKLNKTVGEHSGYR